MFPDSSVLEYILICWRLQLKAIGFLLHDDNSASIRDEMHDLLITCLLPRQRETKYRQKKVRGRLRQSESGPGNCVVFLSKTTPSWTVLSPAEKGGRLGVRLATLPRKNHVATETPMINQQTLQVLEEEELSSRRCMTSCRESRKEAVTLTTLLTTRKTLNIRTWNIRKMFELIADS